MNPRRRYNTFMWVIIAIALVAAILTRTIVILIAVTGFCWFLDFVFGGSSDSWTDKETEKENDGHIQDTPL